MIISVCHGNSTIMKLLGPLDKRTLRTRCVACALRKIKASQSWTRHIAFDTYLFQCEGSPPCAYCTKKKQICISQNQLQSKTAKFVQVSPFAEGNQGFSATPSLPEPSKNISTLQNKSIKEFFSGFMFRNELGCRLDLETIISGFQNSPSLYNAVLAVGATQASRGASDSTSHRTERTSKQFAMTSYRNSIVKFQEEVTDESVLLTESSLWTTFFLGLFEVEYLLIIQYTQSIKLYAAYARRFW